MTVAVPSIAIGQTSSPGGGATTTGAIGLIGAGLSQVLASGALIQMGGSVFFKLQSGTLSEASPAQIGRVIDGVTITAAMVAQNQALLNQVGAYCRANGIGVIVSAQLDLPPAQDWTYQVLNPAVQAGLPIVAIENVDEPGVSTSPTPTNCAQFARNMAAIVSQYSEYYPAIRIGQWVAGSADTASLFWSAYNQLAAAAHLPVISYVVADTSWNTPWLFPDSQAQAWLAKLSSMARAAGMSLTVLTDGINTALTPSAWAHRRNGTP